MAKKNSPVKRRSMSPRRKKNRPKSPRKRKATSPRRKKTTSSRRMNLVEGTDEDIDERLEQDRELVRQFRERRGLPSSRRSSTSSDTSYYTPESDISKEEYREMMVNYETGILEDMLDNIYGSDLESKLTRTKDLRRNMVSRTNRLVDTCQKLSENVKFYMDEYEKNKTFFNKFNMDNAIEEFKKSYEECKKIKSKVYKFLALEESLRRQRELIELM